MRAYPYSDFPARDNERGQQMFGVPGTSPLRAKPPQVKRQNAEASPVGVVTARFALRPSATARSLRSIRLAEAWTNESRAHILNDRWNPIPAKSLLARNFPNPFNPETWIPFDLAETADVTLRIYDAGGNLVRELALGERPAGTYRSRDRAVHWDGRNAQGERVAGGVYFAELLAGNRSQVRRMVVSK